MLLVLVSAIVISCTAIQRQNEKMAQWPQQWQAGAVANMSAQWPPQWPLQWSPKVVAQMLPQWLARPEVGTKLTAKSSVNSIDSGTLRNLWEGTKKCSELDPNGQVFTKSGVCLSASGVNYGDGEIQKMRATYGEGGQKIWDDLIWKAMMNDNLIKGNYGVSQGGTEMAAHFPASLQECFDTGKKYMQHSVIWRDCAGGANPVIFLYTTVDEEDSQQWPCWFRKNASTNGPVDVRTCHDKEFCAAVQAKCLTRMGPMARQQEHTGPCFVPDNAAMWAVQELVVKKLRDELPNGVQSRGGSGSNSGGGGYPTAYTQYRKGLWNESPYVCSKDGHRAPYNSDYTTC